ncbi:uncharacterized protein LOC105276286 [Ooceraea biroi]|uniref:uncharacterized protein LOC105276286 n=1 Tax=Ooceraea biroi TaxID=2015173 RepID=UPI000F087008|nr:uncharacterized protein LOC105276286 [Ooceraea biroi]
MELTSAFMIPATLSADFENWTDGQCCYRASIDEVVTNRLVETSQLLPAYSSPTEQRESGEARGRRRS